MSLKIELNTLYTRRLQAPLTLDGVPLIDAMTSGRAMGELLETFLPHLFSNVKKAPGNTVDCLIGDKKGQIKSFKNNPKDKSKPCIYTGPSSDFDKPETVVSREQRIENLFFYYDCFDRFLLMDKRRLDEATLSFLLLPTAHLTEWVEADVNKKISKGSIGCISLEAFEAGIKKRVEIVKNEKTGEYESYGEGTILHFARSS